LPFIEHLAELRKVLIISIVVIICFAIVSYVFSDQILDFLTKHIKSTLVFLSPPEAFYIHLKVALFCGFISAAPILLYEFWKFLLPALKNNEKRFLYILFPFSLILFLVGIVFCFMIIIPLGIRFFMKFASSELQPMISLSNYISFLISFLVPFGLIFELPLIISLMIKLRLITVEQLKKTRKYTIIIFFIIGGILTPPDVITQAVMAIPLILLYEVSIILAKIISSTNKR